MNKWLVGWLVGWLIDWLIDWLIHWFINWLIDWMIDDHCLHDWMIDRFIHVNRFIDWLVVRSGIDRWIDVAWVQLIACDRSTSGHCCICKALIKTESLYSQRETSHCTCFEFSPERTVKHLSWHHLLKELRNRSSILKKMAKLFKIFICNPFQPAPSSAILVPFCFRITPLVFFFLGKPLFLGFAILKA